MSREPARQHRGIAQVHGRPTDVQQPGGLDGAVAAIEREQDARAGSDHQAWSAVSATVFKVSRSSGHN